MVEVGRINKLVVLAKSKDGVLLDGGESGDILLKGRSNASKHHPGDEIEVFIYIDKDQRLMATTRKPYAMVGEFAELRVVATSNAGAFLGWGLEDDLFVPKSEQQAPMRKDTSYVVFVFLSQKTNRITASSKLDAFLGVQPPKYKEGDQVDLLVYGTTDLGYTAIVNYSHIGMIYKNEVFQKLVIGQQLQGYVKKVRPDLKIDLRLQQTGYQPIDDISTTILNTIKGAGGMVKLTDKSPPEDIYTFFGVSKKVFKKAIGALYKKKLIIIDQTCIKLDDFRE